MNNTNRALSEVDVVYEDNHYIALNKQAGDLVQGDATGDESLTEALKDFLKDKYQKPGNVFAAPCHRLDRPVQGIVLFAKTSKGASRMATLFNKNQINKTYLAIVEGTPNSTEGKLSSYLVKDRQSNIVKSLPKPSEGAKLAITRFKVLESGPDLSLLELHPETGRAHQLRVHMAEELGCIISGDVKYGSSRKTNDRSLYLLASSLQFTHPIRNEEIEIKVLPPESGLWKKFARHFV